MNTFPTNFTLVEGNLTVKPCIRLARRPLVLDGGSKLHPIRMPIRMECNASELGAKDLITIFYLSVGNAIHNA
jgi:hypothetical protein